MAAPQTGEYSLRMWEEAAGIDEKKQDRVLEQNRFRSSFFTLSFQLTVLVFRPTTELFSFSLQLLQVAALTLTANHKQTR